MEETDKAGTLEHALSKLPKWLLVVIVIGLFAIVAELTHILVTSYTSRIDDLKANYNRLSEQVENLAGTPTSRAANWKTTIKRVNTPANDAALLTYLCDHFGGTKDSDGSCKDALPEFDMIKEFVNRPR